VNEPEPEPEKQKQDPAAAFCPSFVASSDAPHKPTASEVSAPRAAATILRSAFELVRTATAGTTAPAGATSRRSRAATLTARVTPAMRSSGLVMISFGGVASSNLAAPTICSEIDIAAHLENPEAREIRYHPGFA
jgi:hypothetical protein